MPPIRQHALLFLDVDGTLLPFGDPTPHERPGILNRLNPHLGPLLVALPCELTWATTWDEEANTEIAPRLGLPALPVVTWPDPTATVHEDRWFGLHWKTRALVDRANGRPFIWVDDEITSADQDWVHTKYPGRALLHRVVPSRGLTVEDVAVLDEWLR